MSIREKINRNPRTSAAVSGGVVLIAVAVIVWLQLPPQIDRPEMDSPPKAFFTVDDGKTYFPDALTKVPPFTTADGKTAYRVQVAQCGTGKPFVSHLEKYSADDKKKLEDLLATPDTYAHAIQSIYVPEGPQMLVKKPLTGDRGWAAVAPGTIMQPPACRDGSPAEIVWAE
jgi:hypothetical protein